MDLAKTLIRTIVRAFYETKHVLVIDALMVHSALPNEDLAFVLGMQQKDLRKLCGRLREDRLLAVHTRPEIREGLLRPVNKDYYFIDFHATIDAIKYRVFRLTENVKAMYRPTEEKKDFFCPQCGAKWSLLEVLDKVGPTGDFECHRCGGILEREESSAGDSAGHEKQSKLMSQLEGVLKLLQQIDAEEIPHNDFETAIARAVPIQRDPATAPATRATVPLNGTNGVPTAVHGLAQNVMASLDVSVTAGSEKTAAEQAAEAQRKANIAAQNVLPVWHTTSTVTGQSTVDGPKIGETATDGGDLTKEDEEDTKDNKLNEELMAYYDQMAQESEKKAREEREADESSDDEEDEFEDVGLSQGAVDTPSSSQDADGHVSNELLEAKKPKEPDSGSSGPATNVGTPAGLASSQDGEPGPAVKKVKFEQMDGEDGMKSGKDSDEDEEFEDAL